MRHSPGMPLRAWAPPVAEAQSGAGDKVLYRAGDQNLARAGERGDARPDMDRDAADIVADLSHIRRCEGRRGISMPSGAISSAIG